MHGLRFCRWYCQIVHVLKFSQNDLFLENFSPRDYTVANFFQVCPQARGSGKTFRFGILTTPPLASFATGLQGFTNHSFLTAISSALRQTKLQLYHSQAEKISADHYKYSESARTWTGTDKNKLYQIGIHVHIHGRTLSGKTYESDMSQQTIFEQLLRSQFIVFGVCIFVVEVKIKVVLIFYGTRMNTGVRVVKVS